MHRKQALDAIASHNVNKALGSLNALNGLLPVEYRITIDDNLYQEKIKTNIFAVCEKCKKEFDYNNIRVLNLLNSNFDYLLSGKKHRRVWYCSCDHCNTEPFKLIETTLKEPYFLQVIPKPPKRQQGINDRRSFPERFEKWAWRFMDELEERMAQYRDDNWERGGGEMGQGPDVENTYEEEQAA